MTKHRAQPLARPATASTEVFAPELGAYFNLETLTREPR
jgi:hypothetical protein